MNWQPDTCGCYLEYTNNEVYVRPISKCKDHQTIKDSDLDTVVKAENHTKNNAVGEAIKQAEYVLTAQDTFILGLIARMSGTHMAPLNIPDKVIHPDKGIAWSLDAARNIQIDLTGFTASETQAVQTAINNNLGTNIVIVNQI